MRRPEYCPVLVFHYDDADFYSRLDLKAWYYDVLARYAKGLGMERLGVEMKGSDKVVMIHVLGTVDEVRLFCEVEFVDDVRVVDEGMDLEKKRERRNSDDA